MQEIRDMKRQPGKDIHAVGGATLVGSLMNLGLLDELRLVVHPIVLGGGKALFKDIKGRHALKQLRAEPLKSGQAILTFSAQHRRLRCDADVDHHNRLSQAVGRANRSARPEPRRGRVNINSCSGS